MQEVERLRATVEAMRPLVVVLARGFTLMYQDHRNAMVCALCDAQYACDDFGMDSKRDTPGWYEAHITHTAECPVTQARALKERLGW